MLMALTVAFALIEGPLPPPPVVVRAAAPCDACTCCVACPCDASKVKTVSVKAAAVTAPTPPPVKQWVRLTNDPGVEAYGVLGPDGCVTGIEARRYWSAPPPLVTYQPSAVYAPRLYFRAGSACANGSCARP